MVFTLTAHLPRKIFNSETPCCSADLFSKAWDIVKTYNALLKFMVYETRSQNTKWRWHLKIVPGWTYENICGWCLGPGREGRAGTRLRASWVGPSGYWSQPGSGPKLHLGPYLHIRVGLYTALSTNNIEPSLSKSITVESRHKVKSVTYIK